MTDTTLLACPFCGGDAVFSKGQMGCVRAQAHYIECLGCAASTDMDFSSLVAANKWNTRATGWISVNNQIPEHQQIFLAIGKSENMMVLRCDRTERSYVFMSPDLTYQVRNVTHWMPLPIPPKDE